jgi:aminoglycoside/choline kinase family phosphotransferase
MRVKQYLLSLYEGRFGHAPESITDLRADGSDRKIYRLTDTGGTHVIGVYGPDHEENRAFLSFSNSFRAIGLPVPEIYGVNEEAGVYLEEDLGDTTLFDALSSARLDEKAGFPESILPIYRQVVAILPRFQVEGGRVIDYSVAYPYEAFDRRSIMWDLNYFKYHFLKPARVRFNEARLENDFVRLCDLLLRADRTHFLYRDFQSRNIMLRSDGPWFIDYQGGRRGALQYDIASLLYDAKAAIPERLRSELLGNYLDALEGYAQVNRSEFLELYRGYVLVRIMQAMGAYGYRGIFERKPHFLASIPYAVENIRSILAEGPLPVDLPELRAACEQIIDPELLLRIGEATGGRSAEGGAAYERNGSIEHPAGKSLPSSDSGPLSPVRSDDSALRTPHSLTVRIQSFSYRKGYPEDSSGNGGGFVFDCRALHNPGRYEEYREFCGRDTCVIEFLEREEGVGKFWENVRGLVESAVENYLERGFANLSVAFGCTGGQHRSVYFAERLARHLREAFPQIAVELAHREESAWSREPAISNT